MRFVVFIVLAVVLFGCATTEKRKDEFTQSMDTWVGRTADELVVAKGPPTSTFTLSTGGQMFEYSDSWTETRGGGSYTVTTPVYKPATRTWEQVPQQRASAVMSSKLSCKILFKISPANVVESWASEGNDCY